MGNKQTRGFLLMKTSTLHIVRPDAKGRITLGQLAVGVSSFAIHIDKHHRIILEPFAEIPAKEKWLYQNKEAFTAS